MVNKKHYFYVLHCQDHTFYAGYTTDPANRLKVHNDGKGAKYTRPLSRRPAQMIYLAVFETKQAAMKAEYAFKQLSRRQKETFLQTNQSEPLPNNT